jgi:hypothetical protein
MKYSKIQQEIQKILLLIFTYFQYLFLEQFSILSLFLLLIIVLLFLCIAHRAYSVEVCGGGGEQGRTFGGRGWAEGGGGVGGRQYSIDLRPVDEWPGLSES